MSAAPDCAALARHPTWAECAAALPHGVTGADVAAFDRPVPLQFEDDGAAAVASMDWTTLAVQGNASPQVSTPAPSTVAAIPEPHTSLLMLAGLAVIGFMATRRRRP